MLGDVNLAVIDHDGLRRQRRTRRPGDRTVDRRGVDQQGPGNAVLGPHCMRGPVLARRSRPERLIQRGGGVHRLRRHRRQPDTDDTAGVPVHSHGQLGLHPAQCHRIQGEHVQPGGVHQQVLTWSGRAQLPVRLVRSGRDIPIAFGAQPERRMPPFQLLEHPKRRCPRGQPHHVRPPEPGDRPGIRTLDHHRPRRPRLIGVLDHHFQGRLHPPVIGSRRTH